MARLMPPFQDLAHILGTDPLGRDVLARVIVGGKISLIVGVFSVLRRRDCRHARRARSPAITAASPKFC